MSDPRGLLMVLQTGFMRKSSALEMDLDGVLIVRQLHTGNLMKGQFVNIR